MNGIAILGGGAWGTALAALYASAGRDVMLYARDREAVAQIRNNRRNPAYLPDTLLPESMQATSDLGEALEGRRSVLVVVPAQVLRSFSRHELRPLMRPDATLVLCAKGIERESGLFTSNVVAEELPGANIAVLSGPSFAGDVAAGLPTAVTVAAESAESAEALTRELSTGTFRGYASDDRRGVEAGGALKNVLALAAGIVSGRGLGASAQAAMVTRGFVELRKLGQALGGRPETLMGLSGLGDLILTASGPKSRNFAFGAALGEKRDVSGMKLAEGVYSARIAADIARREGIEAPIIGAVAGILTEGLDIDEAMRNLLARPLKREIE